MHGDAADVSVQDLHLASMESGSDLDAELANRVPNRVGAADRPSWPVKGREEPIAGGLDLSSSVAAEFAPG